MTYAVSLDPQVQRAEASTGSLPQSLPESASELRWTFVEDVAQFVRQRAVEFRPSFAHLVGDVFGRSCVREAQRERRKKTFPLCAFGVGLVVHLLERCQKSP